MRMRRSLSYRSKFSRRIEAVTNPIPIRHADAATQGESGESMHLELVPFFQQHHEALVRFLAARLGSSEEAADVAQETYVRILDLQRPGLMSHLHALLLLYRVANHIASNRLKQSHRHTGLEPMAFPAELTPPAPQDTCMAHEELAMILRAVQELPPRCRAAFILVRVQGVSVDEAAQRMGLTPGTVWRYLARATAHCQRCVDETREYIGECRPAGRDGSICLSQNCKSTH